MSPPCLPQSPSFHLQDKLEDRPWQSSSVSDSMSGVRLPRALVIYLDTHRCLLNTPIGLFHD